MNKQFAKTEDSLATRTLLTILTLALFASMLSIATPLPAHAFNGYLEDCDFDGRDDETGVPVPFPGFDETRGDTVPANWDRINGRYIEAAPEPAPSGNADTNSGTGSGSNTNNGAGSGTNGGSSGGTSSNPNNAANTTTGDEVGINAAEDDSGSKQSDGSSLASSSAISPELAAIVNKKGRLTITASEAETSGTETTPKPGSTITLKGSGFAGNAKGLTIELHSTPVTVGTVNTQADGSFELNITIPENLEAGRHNIVVSYQGYPIVQKSIEIAPAVATNAATTGGIAIEAGVAIIAGLIIAAVALLIFWKIKKNQSQKITQVA